MKITLNKIFILLSILSIIVILIDFNLKNEFFIENGIIVLIIIPFVVNILRLSIKKLNSRIFEYIFNSGMILFSCFVFIYLGFLSWGHAFVGKDAPLIFECGFYLNLLFIFFIIVWFVKQLQKKFNY